MYIAVLSKGNAGKEQVYSLENEYPQAKIAEYQSRGYFVDDIGYGGEVWTISASDRKKYADQKVLLSETFPEAEIESLASEGYFISDCTYGKSLGNKVWGVVLVKGSPIEEQIILTDKVFPWDIMQDKLLESYRVIDIAIGKEGTKVVMAKGRKLKITSQDVMVTAEFPEEYLKDKTQMNDYPSMITHLSYQDNRWFIVTSFGTEYESQFYYANQRALPSNTIQKGWEDGYIVTEFQKYAYKSENVAPNIPAYLTNYQGRVGCPEILTNNEYNQVLAQISRVTIGELEGDNLRLQVVNGLIGSQSMCMSTKQIGNLINAFEYDESRWNFLEMMYAYTYDKDNYKELKEALGDEKDLLKKFEAMLKKD
jgi:hypothetical protein